MCAAPEALGVLGMDWVKCSLSEGLTGGRVFVLNKGRGLNVRSSEATNSSQLSSFGGDASVSMLEAGSLGGQKVDLGKWEPPSGKVTRPQHCNSGSREPHPDAATHKMSLAAPGTSPPSPGQQCTSSPQWVPHPPTQYARGAAPTSLGRPAVCKAGLSIQAEIPRVPLPQLLQESMQAAWGWD